MNTKQTIPLPFLLSLVVFVLVVQSCNSTTPTPVLTETASPTITTMFTFSPSPTFPPTYTPVFTPTLEQLTTSFIAQCDKALNKTAQSGKLELPLLALRNVSYENQGWQRFPQFPHIQTQNEADARTLVCIHQIRKLTGHYSDGAAAYQLFEEVRVVRLSDGKVIFAESLTGDTPPNIKTGIGDGYGLLPAGNLESWLYDNADDPAILYINGGKINDMALSPDGTLLAIALSGPAGSVRLWDLAHNREAGRWDIPAYASIQNIVFSPDGQSLAYTVNVPSTETYIVDPTNGQSYVSIKGDQPIFSSDGHTILTRTDDPDSPGTKKIVRWDVDSGQEIETLFGFSLTHLPADVSNYTLSPDGNTMAVSSLNINDPGTSLILWSVPQKQIVTSLEKATTGAETDWLTDTAVFSPDGRLLASSDIHREISLWDLETRARLRQLEVFSDNGPIQAVTGTLAFSPDGKYLAVGMRDSTVRIWDTTTLLEVHTLLGHVKLIVRLAFSPDNRSLVSASSDGTIRLWDLSAP